MIANSAKPLVTVQIGESTPASPPMYELVIANMHGTAPKLKAFEILRQGSRCIRAAKLRSALENDAAPRSVRIETS
jgi:hypothetical protein